VNRALDQVLRERRFGRENPLPAGDSGGIIAIRVIAPGLGQVQGAIDERVPALKEVAGSPVLRSHALAVSGAIALGEALDRLPDQLVILTVEARTPVTASG
jgi:hypothetical protein